MKITPREKRRHAACRLFSRGMIFMRARVSLALLSLRKNGGTTRSLTVNLFISSFTCVRVKHLQANHQLSGETTTVHSKCEDFMVAYRRWSFTRIKPQGVSFEKKSSDTFTRMTDDLLHAISKLRYV